MFDTREQYLQSAVEAFRPEFEVRGYPLPKRIRVTCGFPSSKARSQHKAIGEHWSPVCSTDNHHEIMVSPVLADPLDVMGTLVHELCHAATDGDGHKGRFPAAARALHLEGKPTTTTVGDQFRSAFGAKIAGLGVYPHAALNVFGQKKTQSTRMLKASCSECGYTIRISAKWAYDNDGLPNLPECPNDDIPLEISR